MTVLHNLNRPWLHFIALGIALFLLQGFLFPQPKPVIGPLSEERVQTLREQWYSTTSREPDEAQLERMIRTELDRDMLFQKGLEVELHKFDSVIYQRLLRNMSFLRLDDGRPEMEQFQQALDMRLHLGDEVVKRRIIQVMEQLLLAASPPLAPTEADIEAAYQSRLEELRLSPRYSIQQIYFNREREGEAAEVVAKIQGEQLSVDEALAMSSPFLPGYTFNNHTSEQLARQFGAAFVLNFEQAQPLAGHWLGPVRSTYGLHYVWVESVTPARDATLEEVHSRLQRDLESQAKHAALQAAIDQLRKEYEVLL
jgi:PPIC-type PPIASE domain